MQKKILIAGASGYRNTGDDSYKIVLEEYLGKEFDLYFDSPYPDLRYFDFIDYLVIGGGGLIYDNGTEHFDYMKMYMETAIAKKIPFSFVSCGVQIKKFAKKLSEQEVIENGEKEIKKWAPYLEKADFITVRAEVDVKIIKTLCPKAIVKYVPDLVYLLEPCEYHLTLPKSVVFVATGLGQKINKEVFNTLWEKYAPYGEKRYVVSMAKTDDEVSVKLSQKINGHGNFADRLHLSPKEIARIIKDADAVVSERYHGHVIANAMKVKEVHNIDTRYKSWAEKAPKDIKEAEENINLIKKYANRNF